MEIKVNPVHYYGNIDISIWGVQNNISHHVGLPRMTQDSISHSFYADILGNKGRA